MVLGTPAYMSPEQCRGDRDLGPASDVYALGLVMYEMLAGRGPFQDAGVGELLLKQVHERPEPPHRWNAYLPRSLERVVMRALEKDPADRYADTRELTAALEACSPDALSMGDADGVRALEDERPRRRSEGNTTLSGSVVELPTPRPVRQRRSSRVLIGLVALLMTAWASAWLDHAGVVPAPLHAATDMLASLWPAHTGERRRAARPPAPIVAAPPIAAVVVPPPAPVVVPPVPPAPKRRARVAARTPVPAGKLEQKR
jgi:hypothetical protein